MNIAIILIIVLRRRRAGCASWCPGPLDAAGLDDPDRLAGACKVPRCGEVVNDPPASADSSPPGDDAADAAGRGGAPG